MRAAGVRKRDNQRRIDQRFDYFPTQTYQPLLAVGVAP